MASSRDDATSTSPVASTVVVRLKIMLIRPGNGLNLGGIDSHVFRPMMTAFVMPGDGGVDVTSLKCAMSPGSRHGYKLRRDEK